MAAALSFATRIQATQKTPLTAPQANDPEEDLLQTASAAKSTWEYAKELVSKEVGRRIRDAFFLPIPTVLSPNLQTFQRVEEAYYNTFFNPQEPVDINFPTQSKIREKFCLFDQQIIVKGKDGRDIIQTCRILESKHVSDHPYTFVYVAGNLVTINNNITSLYPYLKAFVEQVGENPRGARFFVVTQNDMVAAGTSDRVKPETIDEGGFILTQTLLAIRQEYGEIHQVVAHSLGCIMLAGGLKYFPVNKEAIPHSILFDRGPSSIAEASKHHLGGTVLNYMAGQTGWAIDVGRAIEDFFSSLDQEAALPNVVVSGVVEDHHFPGSANLCLSPQIAELQKANKVAVLYFRPPIQVVHEHAHHSYGANKFHAMYLVPPSTRNFFVGSETLAGSTVRHSLAAVIDITKKVA